MKTLLTILLIVVPAFAFSQKMGRFFYNKKWELTTRDSATYIRMCVYDTLNHYFAGPVTDMFLSGKPQMKGYYSALKKNGVFTSFYETGVIESTGTFQNDARVGLWTYNYPNGNKKMEVEYTAWDRAKIISSYSDSGVQLISNGNGAWYEEYEEYDVPGTIIVTGELKNYEKHGTWTCKLSTGEMIYSEEYREEGFIKGVTYDNGKQVPNNMPHGNQLIIPFKFLVTEGFGSTTGVDFTSYPLLAIMRRGSKAYYNARHSYPDSLRKDGTVLERYTQVDEAARPPKGMASFYQFVANELKYPMAARKAGAQGKVFVEFIIDKAGVMSEFAIIKSDSPLLDGEAIRVFKAYGAKHKWRPGMQRGKPVKQRMVMPMTFRIG